jgi:hypothetical protein
VSWIISVLIFLIVSIYILVINKKINNMST